MEPSKSTAKTKSKCPDCVEWEHSPLWGHKLCSYHRDCSGKDNWEPNNCGSCKKQKTVLAKISEDDRTKFYQEMYEMLEITKQTKYQTVKVDWEYVDILKSFLDNFEIPQLSTENVDSQITTQNHDNAISNDNNTENENRDNRTETCTAEYEDPYNYDENDDNNYHSNNHDYNNDNHDNSFQQINRNISNNANSDHINEQFHNEAIELPHGNMHNNYNSNQFPTNYQNQPNQYRLPEYDYYGRKIIYNVSNNDAFHREPQNYSFQGTAPPVQNFQPVHNFPPVHNLPPVLFQSHNLGVQPHKSHEVDPTTGETWLYFDSNYHTRKDSNKLEMWTPDGPKVINVQYRIGNPNMFKTITTTANSNISPFIDGREGHSVLLTSLNRSVSSNDFGATKRIPFETRLETGSGLATTLDLIKKHEMEMSEQVFDNNVKSLHELFPTAAFNPVTLADFTSGWNLSSSSFVAFAKDKDLVVKSLNRQLNINVNFNVSQQILTAERDARRRLVDTLTSLHLLDLYGEKIDSIDEHIKRVTRLSSSQTKAIARTMLPNLKMNIINWKYAKMKVRKSVLKDHTNSNNLVLLKSSMWDENLFPKKVTDDLLEHAGRNMAPLLGLGGANSSGNNNYRYTLPNRNYSINRKNQYNRPQGQYEAQNHTFRETNQGGAQKSPQNVSRKPNTTQQTKISTRGGTNPSSYQNQGQSNRGRGRGKGPYTRPTSAYKTNAQNK